MIKTNSIQSPTWLPQALSSVIDENFSQVSSLPNEIYNDLKRDYVRLATDARMKTVWQEIYRREGGIGSDSFSNPANKKHVTELARQLKINNILKEEEEFIQTQNLAAAILFLESFRLLMWDSKFDIGPHVKTLSEIKAKAKKISALAENLKNGADIFEEFGRHHQAKILRSFLEEISLESKTEMNSDRDPWIVERRSTRVGDDGERGIIIGLGQVCSILFGKKMLGTVKTLANVLLNKDNITVNQVQGVLKKLP